MSYSPGLEVHYETPWKPGGTATAPGTGRFAAAPRVSPRRGGPQGGRGPAQRPAVERSSPRARSESSPRQGDSWPAPQAGRPRAEVAEARLAGGSPSGRVPHGSVDLPAHRRTDSGSLWHPLRSLRSLAIVALLGMDSPKTRASGGGAQRSGNPALDQAGVAAH